MNSNFQSHKWPNWRILTSRPNPSSTPGHLRHTEPLPPTRLQATRTFLKFVFGSPPDLLGRIFASLDAQDERRCVGLQRSLVDCRRVVADLEHLLDSAVDDDAALSV